MTYKFDDYNWLVRINKGEKLVESLLEIIKKEQIKGAWVSGLGGSLSATLGFYDLEKKEYHFQDFNELMEITSLQGNIASKGGEPVLHLHATLSNKNMQGFGGHVKEITAAGTIEVLIHRWYETGGLTRSIDQETGLSLLDV